MGAESEVTVKLKPEAAGLDSAINSATSSVGKLENAVKGVDAAADKAEKSLRETGDAAKHMGDAADTTVKKVGGVDDVFETLQESGGKLGKSVGAVGTAMISAVMIFDELKQAGEALGEMMGKLVDKLAKAQEQATNLATHSAKMAQATKLAEQGVIEFGGSIEQLEKNFDSYKAKMGIAIEANAQLAGGLKDPKTAMQDVADAGERMANTLEGAFKRGKEGGLDWTRVNKKAIEDQIAALKEYGLEVPEQLEKALVALDKQTKARQFAADSDKRFFEENKRLSREAVEESNKAAEAQKKAYEANTAAIDEYIAKLRELEAAHIAANAAAIKQTQIVQELANAHGQATGNAAEMARAHKAIAESIAAGQQPVVQMTIMQLELTEATEAQIEALRNMGGAMESVADGTSKLTDYLANLLDGFRSGATSAFTTIEQLSIVIRQLEDLLSKNMGTKFEADIRKMLDAYRELRDELRMGGVEKEQTLRI